jgi:microcystin-dependent protein
MPDTGAPANLPYPDQTDPPIVPADLQALAEAIELGVLNIFRTGTIIAFGSATPPPGWALCDGSLHGSPDLQLLISSPNSPDLRDRFLIGNGPKAVRSTGGQMQVALGTPNVPSHAHGFGVGGSINDAHTHVFNASGGGLAGDAMNHNHAFNGAGGGGLPLSLPTSTGRRMAAGGSPFRRPTNAVTCGGAQGPVHAHTCGFNVVGSGGITAGHVHGVTTDAQGGGQLHGGPPAFYAVTFIIKK